MSANLEHLKQPTEAQETESMGAWTYKPTARGIELLKDCINRREAAYKAFLESFDLQPFLESCTWLMSLSHEDVAALAVAERAHGRVLR